MAEKEGAMQQLEMWAFYEDLEKDAYGIMGRLLIEWPNSMDELIERGARLYEILGHFGKSHSIWGCAENFLFLFHFQKQLKDGEILPGN